MKLNKICAGYTHAKLKAATCITNVKEIDFRTDLVAHHYHKLKQWWATTRPTTV